MFLVTPNGLENTHWDDRPSFLESGLDMEVPSWLILFDLEKDLQVMYHDDTSGWLIVVNDNHAHNSRIKDNQQQWYTEENVDNEDNAPGTCMIWWYPKIIKQKAFTLQAV